MMTREDAIYEIRQLAVLSTNKNIERITEALNMAVEALQDEIWKDEPCNECIFVKGSGWCDNCNGKPKGLDALPNNRKTEPTISKMEQVDKDINVRSKDCTTCRFDDKYGEESICSNCSRHYSDCYEPKDEHSGEVTEMVEPQTDEEHINNLPWTEAGNGEQTNIEIARAIVHKAIDDAVIAEDAYPDLRQKMHDAVDNYEPQTDCAWGKGEE
jgi:hypothetical protein